jgi:PAS domain S-box-containing protein
MFLPPGSHDGPVDWAKALDYAQVGVVALAAYLYFFYIPWRSEAAGPEMLARILRVYVLRDGLLVIAFVLYASLVQTRVIRTFLRQMAGFFLAGIIFPLYSLSMPASIRFRAHWADLIWCAPFIFASIVAANWTPPQELVMQAERPLVQGRFASHVLPILIPLLVLFMGRRIATEQMTLAWITITASFVLSSGRLFLANERQRRIASDLQQTQHALQHSEQMFFAAFRSSPDAVGISAIPSGSFLAVNDGFARLTGYSREESLGRKPLELNLWIDPYHRSKVMDRLFTAGEVREEEFFCRTKTGQSRTCQFSGTVIDFDGQRCALVVVRDITLSKEAEHALRVSEERFRTLIREMHVGVILHGPNAEIQFANQAAEKMFGFSLNDIRGKTGEQLDFDCFRQDGTEVPIPMRPGPRVVRTGQHTKDEVVGFRKKGATKILWLLGNVVPQFGDDGRSVGAISTFTDITERRHIEDTLHQLSTRLLQLQDEERRRLGRELHDSLAQSVLAVALNLAKAMNVDSVHGPAKDALAEARRLLQEMAQEIRTMSYLLHPPLLDQLGLVSAVREYAEGFGRRSGIQLNLELPSDFGRLPQNVEMALFRIVQESLANVQRHSGANLAQVTMQLHDDQLILEISDEGHGMVQSAADMRNGKAVLLGVGILGMQERMGQLGGKLDINSSASGTAVRATIPWTAEVFDAGSYPRRR